MPLDNDLCRADTGTGDRRVTGVARSKQAPGGLAGGCSAANWRECQGLSKVRFRKCEGYYWIIGLLDSCDVLPLEEHLTRFPKCLRSICIYCILVVSFWFVGFSLGALSARVSRKGFDITRVQ